MSATGDLANLQKEFEQQASAVVGREAWDALRIAWVGRKQGKLKDLMARMKDIPPEERRDYGQAVNRLKTTVEQRIQALDVELEAKEKAASRTVTALDVTLPGRKPSLGTLHPITLVARQIESIFAELGYSVAEGPEIEDDYHNFEALNFPPDHPARETQDTLFLERAQADDGTLGPKLLLRTHTSPVQIRTMLGREKPPIRVICPGRVYRNDNDLRHSPMFHQVEGLAIAEGLTFGDMKGTLDAFCKRLFSADTDIRLRPSFFPFTEPSAEVDVTCAACKGKGCATCSDTGWMEILGCGMVDPRVLEGCGIDPDRYSGYAFGLGIDRVAMNRYNIPNIRVLFENDERLLRQVRT
ncbi:MAG: phenylalanine--tRNA ligase subunit alpha [Thermoanaerobaculia bacterium]|nr:phenylalanine--tRNA ligase subunit alpha [Thermoanaerobaculia bacterium]